jgi:ABC-2 type transport system permease protein
MVAFAVMNACYVTTVTGTVIARDEGILKRLRGTPLPPLAYIAGRVGASSLVAALSAFLVIVLGHYGYGAEVMLRTLPALVVTVALGMLCFTLVGLAVTVLVPNTDVALPVAYGTLLPLCFVSDVFLPADAAPGWLSAAASAFPVKHLAVALERALNPTVAGAGWDIWHLGILAAWTVAALVVTLVFFRWERRAGGGRRVHLVRAVLRRHPS